MSPGSETAAQDALEPRIDALLARLNLDQKLAMLGGADGFYVGACEAIGLPRLRMCDGPFGLRGVGPETAYAGGIALAASWNVALAERFGRAIGRDARANGVAFWLAPGVNIHRVPMNGRNMEYYGEDPLLAGQLAVAVIRGAQAQGVVATVKHFVANNSELARRSIDNRVDERALREIYLPAFEMAVKEGQVAAVMGAYNRVNGEFMSEHRDLVRGVLKDEWGFDGIFMSDWDATHDGVKAANAGLDLEMPAATAMNPASLHAALADGRFDPATLDDKLRRILRVLLRFGLLDRPQHDPAVPLADAERRAVALDSAREAMVLLKNQAGLLPLSAQPPGSVALLGPRAHPATPTGGGSGRLQPEGALSLLDGVRQQLGDAVPVLYHRGLPTEQQVFQNTRFHTADGKPGLRLQRFARPDCSGTPLSTRRVLRVNGWTHQLWPPPAKRHIGLRWTGLYRPEADGEHLFIVAAVGRDRYSLLVDGEPLIEQPAAEAQAPRTATRVLHKGRPVRVVLSYQPDAPAPRISLGVMPLARLVAPEALALARQAEVAVVAAGFDAVSESEAYDRSFELPWGQEALIRSVAAVNPRTVVTVTAGGAYATENWLPQVPVLLHHGYAGGQAGRAVAEILFGACSPSGKLPMSFERRWEDNPAHGGYPELVQGLVQGQAPSLHYGEGVFVGYRGYGRDGSAPRPLFAFGHGLSYTRFAFTELSVEGPNEDGSVGVSFTLTNIGERAGAEVAQLYVCPLAPRVPRPARELKAFRKLQLAAGASQRLHLVLPQRAFAYYQPARACWQVDPGGYLIAVGNASDHTPLSAELQLR